MLRGHLTRTRLGFVLAIGAGVLLGAILGQPANSRAAANAKPTPKTPPTISGTAEVGVTLVATHGTWNNNPTSFKYAWLRCASDGGACIGISAATARAYTPTAGDIGHTLRVAVTAHNSSGSTTATSTQTGVVPPSGCPQGTGAVPIASLTPPARLDISNATVTPRVNRSTGTIHLHFTITACEGRPVVGASVFATAIPYNQFAIGQSMTAGDGTIVLTESRRGGFPVSHDQRLLAVFVRAWKQGEPETAGVSSSRVVAFHFPHH